MTCDGSADYKALGPRMTTQQIRLYALARSIVPPEFRIKSFRDVRLEIFPRIGIKVEEIAVEVLFDEHLMPHATDEMISREIRDALKDAHVRAP